MRMAEPLTFIRQTFKTFKTTGAVAPSSAFLARAVVKGLPSSEKIPGDFSVLEVGCGTGSITAAIARRMNGHGRLTVYEINPSFVTHLKKRLDSEPCFAPMRGRIALVEGDIRELQAPPRFDAIISGLPFNNFHPEEVQGFLDHFCSLLAPDGTLSFFEYAAIRKIQIPFVGKEKRHRLRAIARVVEGFAERHQVAQEIVLRNLPPARARHFRLCALPPT